MNEFLNALVATMKGTGVAHVHARIAQDKHLVMSNGKVYFASNNAMNDQPIGAVYSTFARWHEVSTTAKPNAAVATPDEQAWLNTVNGSAVKPGRRILATPIAQAPVTAMPLAAAAQGAMVDLNSLSVADLKAIIKAKSGK